MHKYAYTECLIIYVFYFLSLHYSYQAVRKGNRVRRNWVSEKLGHLTNSIPTVVNTNQSFPAQR